MDKQEKKKILVIDDDQDVNNLIAKTLKPEGFDVFAVTDPEECVDSINEIEPDLIFISLLLPESNGLKLSKIIHSYEKFAKVPIIMLISYHGELDPKYTSTIGVVNVLVKPLDHAELVSKTVAAIGKEAPAFEIEPTSHDTGQEEGPDSLSLEDEWMNVMDDDEKAPAEAPKSGGQKSGKPERGPQDNFDFSDEMPSGKPEKKKEAEEPTFDYDLEDKVSEEPIKSPAAQGAKKTFKKPDFSLEDDLMEEGAEILAAHKQDALPDKKSGSAKRILLIAASVLIVAGLSFGAFMMKDTLLSLAGLGKKKTSPQPAATAAAPVRGVAPAATPATTGKEEVPPEAGKAPGSLPPAASPSGDKGLPAPKDADKTKQTAAAQPKNDKTQPPPGAMTAKTGTKEPAVAVRPAGQTGKAAQPETAKETRPAKEAASFAYSVQVGAFGNEKNAVSLAESLKKKGFDAFTEKDEKKKVYRVLVGKFDNSKKASEQVSLLKKEGIKSIIYRH